MRLTVINRLLIVFAILTLISGLRLHIGYSTLVQHHSQYEAWLIGHIVCSALLIILAVAHTMKNNWWFKSLKFPNKNFRTVLQRTFTPGVVLLFLSLVVTGLCMLCGWYSAHSHIWIWHFYLGIAWAVVAVLHGYFFSHSH